MIKIQNSFNEQTSTILGNSQISDFSGKISDLLKATIASPSSVTIGTAMADPGQHITEEQAIDIALAQYPGIEPSQPITIRATLKCHHHPYSIPPAAKLCWVIEISGGDINNGTPVTFHGEPTDKFISPGSIGAIVIIDAVTGEILF